MATREEVEFALLQLRTMVEQDDLPEQRYQTFFETNEFIFHALGWSEFLTHPLLEQEGKVTLIPDFMVKRIDETWEICELKRPEMPLLKSVDRRGGFYASAGTYASQCQDYSEYFDDEINRSRFFDRYQIKVHGHPKAVLIIGRNEGLDRHQLLKHQQRSNGTVRIQTYDDVLNAIDFYRLDRFGETERKEGMAFYFSFEIRSLPVDEPGYILDIGDSPLRNRVTLYATSGACLMLRVIGADGHSHEQRLTMPSEVILGRVYYCGIDIVCSGSETFVLCELDGAYVTEAKIRGVEMDFTWPLPMVVSADMHGSAKINLKTFRMLNRSVTMSLEEKEKLRKWVSDAASGGLEHDVGQYMYSGDHPILAKGENVGGCGLMQEDMNLRPTTVLPDGRRVPVACVKPGER